ncbi:TPA_asm: coat protein [ssRNA phage SRR6960799_32]|uniref:Coat protein n=1 Tax=ssRNA phage SRR6960799_32 TaxID=2786590 RepID=A0A8S5KZ66_9VIRU|nr:coat protein [ssRNA phage SRR6960799_32]DAD50697.1 TPA_asm: coat protein [ssRNA phage SRR6960799_32]
MFSDPLQIYVSTSVADAAPRVSVSPGKFVYRSTGKEIEVGITHNNFTPKGGGLYKRHKVDYTSRKTIDPVSTGSCCTPGYVQEINASFVFTHPVNATKTDVEDVVKALAVWMSEANDATIIDKLINGES